MDILVPKGDLDSLAILKVALAEFLSEEPSQERDFKIGLVEDAISGIQAAISPDELIEEERDGFFILRFRRKIGF